MPITPAPQSITPQPAPATPVPATPVPATPPDGRTAWDYWKNFVPTPAPVQPTPAPAVVTDVGEKRFVGTWTKDAVRKSDPVMRWNIAEDGRYTIFSDDTASDAGTMNAGKGILRLNSETAGQTFKGTYQLSNATRMSAKGVPNAGTWKKAGTASTEPPKERDHDDNDGRGSSKEKSGSSTASKSKSDDTPSRPKPSSTDIERKARDFGNSMRRRFGF
jgi:hypothetical protein